MKKLKTVISVFLAFILVLPASSLAAENSASTLDYGKIENWAYFENDKDKNVDVFLICPTVDTKSETNSFDLNDKLKASFVNALDMEKGIYEETGRLFSPYYRQMSLNAYKLSEEEQAKAREIAYSDISAAFRWYLDNENDGRGFILAGFSQGSQMCLELLKEYFGGNAAEAKQLSENLIAVYSIGWSVTAELTSEYPQIVPAKCETDTGVVVSFDCEDGTLTDTLVIPSGTKALSINPLNWKTDATVADKSLNYGAVMEKGAAPVAALCGAYIGSRGELVVTDINKDEYPAVIDIFPEGSYHIYDYMFFFENLKKNVATRAAAWRSKASFDDVAEDSWYADAVVYVNRTGLMAGTDAKTFSPASPLSRAQLVTILWRMAGNPDADYTAPLENVKGGIWYEKAIYWALQNGIIANSGAHPEELLTREETASILFNYANINGIAADAVDDSVLLPFNDFFNIRAEYVPAVKWVVSSGIMQGVGEGMLKPIEHLTRAQTAVILQKFAMVLNEQSPLSLWTEGAQAKNKLISYIKAITDEASADFIPISDRIAVFDLDGTLFCETDPNYFDYTLLKYRVLEDPDYKNKASDFEKEVANKIKEQNETGKSFSGLEVDHGKAVASAFSGMTVSEFNAYIQEFKKQDMPSYVGMKRGEGFYRPMVQVVNYLQANGFTVYIVSGTDRLIVRGIMHNNLLNIPNRQIIGSDETIVSNNQGDTDGLNYVFAEGDNLILGGDFIIKNLKMNKVSVIMQEIGQQPVLSFGNSTGDSSMAEYVTSNNNYKSLAFMLCCDDTERENGSQSKADKMYSLCEEFDWVPISMKNDWTTIYGEGVTYIKPNN